ncbi:MAG: SurA N-terminal domain-containing protein [Coxiellaceae bacterium]|nr:SurA N-terminal domain-containing protein [Coxiellaceae bacterium]
MERFKTMLVTALLAFPLFGLADETPAEEPMDRIAAIVNNQIITESTLNDEVNIAKNQLINAHQSVPEDKVLQKTVLDGLINNMLQIEIAKKSDIDVDIDELNDMLNHIATQNNMSLERLRQEIEAEGMQYSKFREQIKRQLLIQKIQQAAVGPRIMITDKEVDEFIAHANSSLQANTEYHIADILIALPESPTTEQVQKAEQEAKAIIAKIDDGTAFETVATDDMGWRKYAELPAIFSDELKKMKPGDVHGPLRAPNGLHIIKLIAVKLDEEKASKKQIKNMIYQRKFGEQLSIWIRQLREQSRITINI